MAEVIVVTAVLATLACGALSVPHLRRKSRLKSRVVRRLKETQGMKVKVVHQLGWLELFDLQLVETDGGGDRRNYLLQIGQRRGRATLYRVPGHAQLNPQSPIPPEAVAVEGDERTRVLHAIGEADNGWDNGDQRLLEFTREPATK